MSNITDEYTGMTFDISTPEGAIEAQIELNKLIKSLDKTKTLVRSELEKHSNYEHKGYQIKVFNIQRKTYDPAVLRDEIQDQDLLWEMMTPNKAFIDKYIRDNLDSLGDVSTTLRNSMIEAGKAYTQVKLEKLTRE